MPSKSSRPFDADGFLRSPGMSRRAVSYPPGASIYAQGDPSDTVHYIQQGTVRLSLLSRTGREAVIGVLDRGEFFGEGALAGQPVRLGTARTMAASRVLSIPKQQMIRLLHQQHGLSDRFIAHMLARNSRLEADLVDQLFNASEKRLARTLLLLARYGKADGPLRVVPKVSQEVLAEMVGTTRSRVNFFMNKFRKLGFVEYNGTLKVHHALLSVILLDGADPDS
jgi:CRP/FNR family cyclic AMP-dependent transcriptional regulator